MTEREINWENPADILRQMIIDAGGTIDERGEEILAELREYCEDEVPYIAGKFSINGAVRNGEPIYDPRVAWSPIHIPGAGDQ